MRNPQEFAAQRTALMNKLNELAQKIGSLNYVEDISDLDIEMNRLNHEMIVFTGNAMWELEKKPFNPNRTQEGVIIPPYTPPVMQNNPYPDYLKPVINDGI